MKQAIALFLAIGILFVSAATLWAATASQTFTTSATVPAVSGVSITATSINDSANKAASGFAIIHAAASDVTGTVLSFDPLSFDATSGIYVPDHYFRITANAQGAPMDVTVNYTEGNNPNNVAGASGHGLGWKTTATFGQLTQQGTVAPIPNHPKKKLQDVQGEHILPTEVNVVATVLIYLAIETDPAAAGEPAGIETFNNTDRPGSYSGSLLVSVTVS